MKRTIIAIALAMGLLIGSITSVLAHDFSGINPNALLRSTGSISNTTENVNTAITILGVDACDIFFTQHDATHWAENFSSVASLLDKNSNGIYCDHLP